MPFARTEHLNSLLSKMIKVDDQSRDAVGFVLDKTINDVANYCNIPIAELPEELDYTIVSIAMTFIETHGIIHNANDDEGDVQSITEGDTSVTYRSKAQEFAQILSNNTITDDYYMQLNRFRKMRF